MRILMFLGGFFPPDIRVEKEARSLIKAGHEVLLLSAGKYGMPSEEVVGGIKVIRQQLPQNYFTRSWNFFCDEVCFSRPFWHNALMSIIKQYRCRPSAIMGHKRGYENRTVGGGVSSV